MKRQLACFTARWRVHASRFLRKREMAHPHVKRKAPLRVRISPTVATTRDAVTQRSVPHNLAQLDAGKWVVHTPVCEQLGCRFNDIQAGPKPVHAVGAKGEIFCRAGWMPKHGTTCVFSKPGYTCGKSTCRNGQWTSRLINCVPISVGPTGGDTTPPVVIIYSPLQDATRVSTTSDVILPFNETVRPIHKVWFAYHTCMLLYSYAWTAHVNSTVFICMDCAPELNGRAMNSSLLLATTLH